MVSGSPAAQPVFTVAANRLQLLDTGPQRLEALLRLIEGARESLRVLYYIYCDDNTGAKVRAALLAAAGRGVRVTLIVDGLGSEVAASRSFFAPLREAGGQVCQFIPRWGRKYLLRNHQKLVLADGERAIIGGFNIEDSYFGTPAEHAWRDLGLLVEGPAAMRLGDYYDSLWEWTRQPRAHIRTLNRLLKRYSEPEGPVRWLYGGPTRRLSPWARAVRQAMQKATQVDLISAYFAPNPAMLRRLGRVARRGRVRVVVPSKSDHAIAVLASRFTFRGMLRRGIEVYEYQPTKLHTKLLVVDQSVYVGSANFDMRSLFLNMELMLRIEDPAFAAHVRNYVDGEIADSEAITPEVHRGRMTPWRRVKQAFAYFIMAVVDPNVTHRLNFGLFR